ncbi:MULTISPECIES: hypothetical protein [Streptomyces]|uniref:hypothetical protein n=1 Tax=Streptomyces TaxID=1883 RepID=UPI00163D2E26|nr:MULTISPECIES: hypothetical protein [Streptomyces]MBC2876430.1 hypothetical protein [Streptomyces sp. TYQ1024]UKW27590.1 hypothetical protein MCU78_00015 [Streptomyces sp. TYQ1024]
MDDSHGLPVPCDRQVPAWTLLLDQLHRDLLALAPDYRIEPFDTKIDSLRITVADRFQDSEIDGKSADRATPLTDAAETASKTTCDERGAPDRIRNHGEAPTAVRNQSDPRSE